MHITYVNTGSKPVRIDNVFINNVPYTSWGTTLNITLPIDAGIGVQKTFYIFIPTGATYNSQRITSGVVLTIKLHSTGGKEYFTSVVPPNQHAYLQNPRLLAHKNRMVERTLRKPA